MADDCFDQLRDTFLYELCVDPVQNICDYTQIEVAIQDLEVVDALQNRPLQMDLIITKVRATASLLQRVMPFNDASPRRDHGTRH